MASCWPAGTSWTSCRTGDALVGGGEDQQHHRDGDRPPAGRRRRCAPATATTGGTQAFAAVARPEQQTPCDGWWSSPSDTPIGERGCVGVLRPVARDHPHGSFPSDRVAASATSRPRRPAGYSTANGRSASRGRPPRSVAEDRACGVQVITDSVRQRTRRSGNAPGHAAVRATWSAHEVDDRHGEGEHDDADAQLRPGALSRRSARRADRRAGRTGPSRARAIHSTLPENTRNAAAQMLMTNASSCFTALSRVNGRSENSPITAISMIPSPAPK